MTRFLPLAITCLALTACATTGSTPVTTATVVAKIQADYPALKDVVAVYLASGKASASTAATIAKVEAIADPEIAALSGVSTPSSVTAAVGDMNMLVAALPAGTLTPAVQADITLLLALVSAGLVAAG